MSNKEPSPTFRNKPRNRAVHFAHYHDNNPAVYESFEAFCLWLWDVGIRNYSAQEAFSHIRLMVRLDAVITVLDQDGVPRSAPRPTMQHVGLQRSYFSHYATMLLERHPKMIGFFDMRES